MPKSVFKKLAIHITFIIKANVETSLLLLVLSSNYIQFWTFNIAVLIFDVSV